MILPFRAGVTQADEQGERLQDVPCLGIEVAR